MAKPIDSLSRAFAVTTTERNAALPELPYACGLGTVSLFESDVTLDPLVADDGVIRLRDVAADAELLERFAASAERRDWWLDRLRRVHALLAPSIAP